MENRGIGDACIVGFSKNEAAEERLRTEGVRDNADGVKDWVMLVRLEDKGVGVNGIADDGLWVTGLLLSGLVEADVLHSGCKPGQVKTIKVE